MRLRGKVALITGGGSGIGRACALLFAREGSNVIVADFDPRQAEATVHSIINEGGHAVSVSGDVSVSADASRMVQESERLYGKLDILVNSAGVTRRNALGSEASPEEIWDRIIEVNLKGTYLVSWYSVPVMKRGGAGAIVNLASIIGLVGYPQGILSLGFDAYASSKGGVVQFTRNLAVDCAKDNIRVNCICPGYTETNMTEALTTDPDIGPALLERHPIGRFGRPEDIAYSALYLASDEASYVTGVALPVDGGYTAQ